MNSLSLLEAVYTEENEEFSQQRIMRVIIQIPCYNEAETLPATLQSLPKTVPGVDQIEVLVVNDGSTDATAKVAEACGVDHIIQLPRHVGLAGAFVSGLEACLARGADIIVNTDADNQYRGEDLPRLLEPILSGRADIVVGDRNVASVPAFSPMKRLLQRFGNRVLQWATGTHTPDATSGFRAISREAALRTIVLSEYSYTLETLIQASARKLAVKFVPVQTNPQTRPSRLFHTLSQYLTQSTSTILRAYTMYRPLRVFTILGSLLILGGSVLGVRYLTFYLLGQGAGHIQSVILAAVLWIVGFQVLLIGLLADLIGFNRKILEEILYRLRRIELPEESEPREHQPPKS